MIKFFRDVLDGPVYLIFVVICILLIMAIIGFIMERKKLEKEENDKRIVIGGATPMEPVRTKEVVLNTKEETTINAKINEVESDVQKIKVEENNESKLKTEDVVQVIDFGSTDSVEIDTNIDSN